MSDPATPATAIARRGEETQRPRPSSRGWIALVQSRMRRCASVVLAAVALASLVACDIHAAARNGYRDRAERLLKHDPGLVASKAFDGSTPLHEAAARGDKSMVELLLRYRSQVNPKGSHDRTPLHLAALSGSEEVTEVLLAHRADVNAKDDHGLTPLHLAAENGKISVAEALLNRKAEVKSPPDNARQSEPAEAGSTPDRPRPVRPPGLPKVDVNAKDDRGFTPLHLATMKGHTDMAEFLRQCGGTE